MVLLYVGLLGLAHITVLWLGFPLLHWSGLEPFVAPDGRALGMLCLIGAISLAVATLTAWVLVLAGAWPTATSRHYHR